MIPIVSRKPVRWMVRRKLVTAPWSASMLCHAIVRIRYDVKNGMITRPIRKLRYLPPRKAMTYASG